MKIFLAAIPIQTINYYLIKRPDDKINLLYSFGSDALEKSLNSKELCTHKFFSSVFFDCGTWALNSGGKNPHKNRRLTVENYIAFIKRFGHLCDFYSNFDEDFSPENMTTNLINLNLMEEGGLKPLPVVHCIKGDEIEIFIERGYKHICLGSSEIRGRKSLEQVLQRFDGTEIKLHLLGSTNFGLIANLPIYSCDSAGWAYGVANGYVLYWNPEKEGLNKTDKLYIGNRIGVTQKNDIINYPYRNNFIKFLRDDLDIDYIEFKSSAILQQLVNIRYAVQVNDIVNEIHRKKGFFTAE